MTTHERWEQFVGWSFGAAFFGAVASMDNCAGRPFCVAMAIVLALAALAVKPDWSQK